MPFSIETFYPERGNALCLFSEDVKTKLFSKIRLSTLNITNVRYILRDIFTNIRR